MIFDLFRRKHEEPPKRGKPSEATRARIQAERDLEETRAEAQHYRDLGNRLRELRERNHIAESLIHAFRGE